MYIFSKTVARSRLYRMHVQFLTVPCTKPFSNDFQKATSNCTEHVNVEVISRETCFSTYTVYCSVPSFHQELHSSL